MFTGRESVTPINWDNIPQYLRERACWTVWFIPEWLPGAEKPKKKLRLPSGETMPEKYEITKNTGTFAQVQEACKKNRRFYPGFWIENTDGLIFLDYDGTPGNIPAIPQIPSYCEASAYGYGYHILGWYKGVKPSLPDTNEVYMGGRWIVMTGCIVDNRKDVNDLSDYLKRYIVTTTTKDATQSKPLIIPDTATARHTVLLPVVASMVSKNFPDNAIVAACQEINKERFIPPKTPDVIEAEVRKIIEWVKREELKKEAATIPAPMREVTEDEFNNIGKVENPRLTVNLPDSFVSEYIDYMGHLSDGFSEYQLAGAITLLSTVINRRAYLDLNVGIIHPNVWFFILGVSTISRKTTACKQVEDLIEMVSRWMLLSYPGSVEAFIEDLEGVDRVTHPDFKGHGLLIKDEAAGLLANMQKTYMSDARDTFCHFYECRPFSRKLRSGQRKQKTSFILQEPYLNILLATTPDNFSELTNTLDLTSGWLLRFMFIWPTYERKLRDKTARGTNDRERYNAVLKRLMDLTKFFSDHTIEFNFSIAGQSFYNQWERDHVARIQKSGIDDRGAYDRLSVYALKLAMIYTVAKNDFIETLGCEARTYKVEINDICLSEACRQVDEFFLPTSRLVSEAVGRCEDKNHIEKILGTLKRAGGKLRRSQLLRRVHLKVKDFNEALASLEEGGEVEEVSVRGERCYHLV
jgi:hypothetical protein